MPRGLGYHLKKTLVNRVVRSVAPGAGDYRYEVGTIWVLADGSAVYILQAVTGTTATWINLSAAGDTYVNFEYWEEISSGTSGTITPPTGASFVLDQWPGDIDAVVSTVDTGNVPDGELARTAGGAIVTVTLNSAGAYALSAAPSSYPVAIIWAGRVKLSDFDDTKVLGQPTLGDFPLALNYQENYIDKGSIGASTVTVDVSAAGMQEITGTGNLTLAFSNIPASGTAWHVTVKAVNWGAHVPVYPGALNTPGGASFSLTSSGTDFIEFWGHEGTTTIHGAVASTDSK